MIMDISPALPSEQAKPDAIRILLVDDHEIWRKGLSSMLYGSEFAVVAEASTATEAVTMARASRPQIALLDIRLAEGDGFEVLVALRNEFPDLHTVMLTTYSNPTFMARAVAGGAVGYLLKGVTRSQLLETLRAVVRGEKPLDAINFLRSLKSMNDQVLESDDLYASLSRREDEVLRLLATGLSNRDIARILFIAEGTVKSHVEHILTKLGINDRVQAAVWAARKGLIPELEKN